MSQKTAEQVLLVLSKHLCSQEEVRDIVKDLLKVEGSKSFEKSIRVLWEIVK